MQALMMKASQIGNERTDPSSFVGYNGLRLSRDGAVIGASGAGTIGGAGGHSNTAPAQTSAVNFVNKSLASAGSHSLQGSKSPGRLFNTARSRETDRTMPVVATTAS